MVWWRGPEGRGGEREGRECCREEGKDMKHRVVSPLFHDVEETRKIPDTLDGCR